MAIGALIAMAVPHTSSLAMPLSLCSGRAIHALSMLHIIGPHMPPCTLTAAHGLRWGVSTPFTHSLSYCIVLRIGPYMPHSHGKWAEMG